MAVNETWSFRTHCVTRYCENKLIWYFPQTYKICRKPIRKLKAEAIAAML